MNVRTVRQALQGLGVVAACLLVTDVAQAQGSKPVSFGVMGGLSLPMGSLGDLYDSGYNLTGSVYLKPQSGRYSFRGDVGYDRFEAKGGSNLAGLNFSILSFAGNVVLPLGASGGDGSIQPYVLGGGGIYRGTTSADAELGGGSSSDSNVGITVGGGVEFKLAGFSTFAEAKFTNVFGDASFTPRYIPLTFGVRF